MSNLRPCLPTIDELEKLWDPEANNVYKIRKRFRLAGWWVWSSTTEGSVSAWDFFFGYGERLSVRMARCSYRALCVRGSGE
jgi:hypothetical protein